MTRPLEREGVESDLPPVRIVTAEPAAPPGQGPALPGLVQPAEYRVVDAETGQPVPELTAEGMVGMLPRAVQRAVAALPPPRQRLLADLPPAALLQLVNLPEATQLALIDLLAGRQLGAPAPVTGTPGAMVPTGSAPDPAPTGLPPGLLDLLLGRGSALDRMRGGLGGSVGALTVATPRPPDLSPEGRQRRREAFGAHLATAYERPVPSGARVTASPAVTGVATNHLQKIAERQEAARESEWAQESARTYGQRAAQASQAEHVEKLGKAKTALDDAEAAAKKAHTSQNRKAARATVTSATAAHKLIADNPPDLAAIAAAESGLWRADLAALRTGGMSRDQIDDLTETIAPERLHEILTVHPSAMIARLGRYLTPDQVDELIDAAADKALPPALTDPVVAGLPPLFAAGATSGRLMAALRGLAGQFATLLGATPASCVRLISVGSLPKLSAMLAGGRVAQLDALTPLLTAVQVTRLMDAADTPATLATLGGSGAGPLADLVTATPAATLPTWCRAPVLTDTVQLLAHVALPTCLPILPVLARDGVGPVQLLAALVAGANVNRLCQAVTDAQALLTDAGHALTYFRTNPGNTVQDFHDAVAGPAAQAASRAPVRNGTGHTADGTPYTRWTHHAVLNCRTLHMLLDEGYARIRYIDTFETKTEAVNGGDTEEYEIDTWDGAAWATLWVVHLHRKRGDNKLKAPSAMHLKREKQRKLKDVDRFPIDTDMAQRCRVTNTS